VGTSASKQKSRKHRRPYGSLSASVRDDIVNISDVCDIVTQQIKDELLVREVERSLEVLSETVESFGQIWLSGNGTGLCLAVEVAQKLSTPTSKMERSTRALVIGLNGAMVTTSYGKCGTDDALAAELLVNGRKGDALWCFARDSSSQSLLSLADAARNQLDIPVIGFTSYPGTPLSRFCNNKVCIHQSEEKDQEGYCVEWAHALLANVMCRHLKRIARKVR